MLLVIITLIQFLHCPPPIKLLQRICPDNVVGAAVSVWWRVHIHPKILKK